MLISLQLLQSMVQTMELSAFLRYPNSVNFLTVCTFYGCYDRLTTVTNKVILSISCNISYNVFQYI